MPQFIPYLAFNGNCKEAMHFYQKVFGGKITMMLSGAESPMADQVPKEYAHRIINARMVLKDGSTLMAGDAPAHMPFNGQHGVTIALIYDTEAAGEQVFKALCDGGKITMPWGPTFWAKQFGMVTDKFGTSWAINGEEIAF